jgi:acyl carrier protein
MPDRVIKVFSEILRLPAERLGDETSPDNTPEWDSMATMNLVLGIEDEFDVRLSSREILAMRTIAIVKRVLREKKGITEI